MTNMESVNNLMQKAITDGVFPGGVLLAAKADAVVFFEAYGYADLFSKRAMTKDTIFDLASLTKPLATTLAIMRLVSEHRLGLDQTLGSVLPGFENTDKSSITIRHLLGHNSGLPDYRPYYQTLKKLPPEKRRDVLTELLIAEPLIHPVGKQVLYSDLGFMLLSRVIEQVSGERLDSFVTEKIYRPLGFKNLFFVDLDSRPLRAGFAATEKCPWRKILLNGAVHDDNAYVVGGIEGHAGLFGTADDVYGLLQELMASYYDQKTGRFFEKELVQTFFKQHDDTGRALGFDMPAQTKASCGQYFSKDSVGHLGFTGTSFWMDLARRIIVVLLTNRVHPARENENIKAFRPKLHDTVMENVLNSG